MHNICASELIERFAAIPYVCAISDILDETGLMNQVFTVGNLVDMRWPIRGGASVDNRGRADDQYRSRSHLFPFCECWAKSAPDMCWFPEVTTASLHIPASSGAVADAVLRDPLAPSRQPGRLRGGQDAA